MHGVCDGDGRVTAAGRSRGHITEYGPVFSQVNLYWGRDVTDTPCNAVKPSGEAVCTQRAP
jgi:hypothetical protein